MCSVLSSGFLDVSNAALHSEIPHTNKQISNMLVPIFCMYIDFTDLRNEFQTEFLLLFISLSFAV